MKKVAKLSEINPQLCVSAGLKKLALFKIKNKVYCINNKCTHLWGPLCKGKLGNSIIKCPWHGSKFDIKTGKVKGGPAKKDVKTYKVEIKDGDVYVDI